VAIKLISLLAAALASLPLRAQAADPVGAPVNLATNRPLYSADIKHVGGPDLVAADFAYITFATNKFGFVMPAGFRLETQDAQKVTLVSADFNCLLTFRVLEPLSPVAPELDPAPYRDLVVSRHPGGKLIGEFSLAAAGQRGPVFELRWNAAGAVPRRERVLFVPSGAGVLEFGLVSSLDQFEAGRLGFSSMLASFRAAGADGRLQMPMLSNRY
jgi:hypothetical protein